MVEDWEFEVRLLDRNGLAVGVFPMRAKTVRDLIAKATEFVGRAGAASLEIRPIALIRPAYHPSHSRLYGYAR